MSKIGYHVGEIAKGEVGEFSKILEEVAECEDARHQGCKVMELVELSDLCGAIDLYVQKHFSLNIHDLLKMSNITQRAFINGVRK